MIMSNNGLLTIKEASDVFKINQSTIYKYIQQGRIQSESFSIGGVKIKKVKKQDLESILINKAKRILQTENESDSLSSKAIRRNESDSTKPILQIESLKDTLKEVVKQTISEERSQLMKPIEEQALYRLGGLEKENLFLKQKVETLIQELEKYKALPCQIEERDEEIKSLETKLKEEKEAFEARTIQEKKEALQKIEEEKEEILRVYEAKLLEAEAKQIAISEAWKKELELAKKPWWKFW
jgi:hypothetical protein